VVSASPPDALARATDLAAQAERLHAAVTAHIPTEEPLPDLASAFTCPRCHRAVSAYDRDGSGSSDYWWHIHCLLDELETTLVAVLVMAEARGVGP
jgi:hypothetical protein